jgi:hypothetical protein
MSFDDHPAFTGTMDGTLRCFLTANKLGWCGMPRPYRR